MSCKNLVVVCLVLALHLQPIQGAPRPLNNQVQLQKNLAEFLSHDKQLVDQLKELGFGNYIDILNDMTVNGAVLNSSSVTSAYGKERFRRQAEVELDINGADMGEDEGQKPPGFFDRAAKFVLDLLQRFLKWINTDNN